MSEFSGHWTTDAATPEGHQQASYTQAQNSTIQKVLAACAGFEGVAAGYLNSLAGTVTGANTVAINTGGGVVDGKVYQNDASLNVNVPSAVGGGNTRIDRIVLRASWAAFTVVVTRIAGTDAASPVAPAITQTSGTTYDIMLYQALVTTAGAVTLTDERVYGKVATGGITDGAVTTAKIAASQITNALMADDAIDSAEIADGAVDLVHMSANSVDSTQYVDGSIDYEHLSAGANKLTNRIGNSASDWLPAGVTEYTPSSVRMQCGVGTTGAPGSLAITFPVAFSGSPLVFVTVLGSNVAAYVDPSTTSAGCTIYTTDLAGTAVGVKNVQWIAIGPA